MNPARKITDELIQNEGFSEEQAYEIALESGQSWQNPLEDDLTSTLGEGEELDNLEMSSQEIQSNPSADLMPLLEEDGEESANPLASQPVNSGNKGTFPAQDMQETSDVVNARRHTSQT